MRITIIVDDDLHEKIKRAAGPVALSRWFRNLALLECSKQPLSLENLRKLVEDMTPEEKKATAKIVEKFHKAKKAT